MKVLTSNSSSSSISHPPSSRNVPFLLLLLPRLLLHLSPRPRPPPGPPVCRDVEQPAVVVANCTGDRGALPEILPRSRRAELHSRWSRGVNAESRAARCGATHLAGTRFCFTRNSKDLLPSQMTTKIAHSLSLSR